MKTLLQANGSKVNEILYATQDDFCRIFNEEMNGLYWLALLLTADHAKAEQCFVAALEECTQTSTVFKDWAHSWTRRTIIKKAIQMINPAPQEFQSVLDLKSSPVEIELEASLAAVAGLETFQRFVLVMSVLEGYSNQDCATLLNCTRHDVVRARIHAVQQLAKVAGEAKNTVESGDQALRVRSLALSGVA